MSDESDGISGQLSFPFEPIGEWQHILVGIFLTFVGISGTVANGLAIISFFKTREPITPTNLFLINLCIADLGICLLGGFPFSAPSSFAGRWLFGNVGCQYYAFMGFLFGTGSIFSLMLIAIDRYLVLCRRELSTCRTFQRYFYALGWIWLYSLFWAVMPLVGWGRYGFEPSVTTCTIDWRHNDKAYRSFILVYFSFGFMLPAIIVSVCYYHATGTIKELGKTGQLYNPEWVNETNVTNMSILLVAGFLVFWSPYAIVCLWTVFSTPASMPSFMTLLPPIFAKTSTLFNPIVYYYCDPRIKTGVWNFLKCRSILRKDTRTESAALALNGTQRHELPS